MNGTHLVIACLIPLAVYGLASAVEDIANEIRYRAGITAARSRHPSSTMHSTLRCRVSDCAICAYLRGEQ